jgi:SAM-dependent methyltransferase
MPSDQPADEPRYERRSPSAQNIVDIFRGQWASDLSFAGVSGTGDVNLFADDKPAQAAQMLGRDNSLAGYSVLEFGPLEGADTCLLEKLGASVTAVESNIDAFLRCLAVKEILGLRRSRFLLGDGVKFLSDTGQHFNLIFCSGFLHHMSEPLELIRQICSHTIKCFVSTHYYHPDRKPKHIQGGPLIREVAGFFAAHWPYVYESRPRALIGGTQASALWLERDAMLEAFRYFGLSNVTVVWDDPAHTSGPTVTFCATT